MFDSDKCQTLTGTVVQFDLTYPHAWLWVLVGDSSDAKAQTWGFEGSDPSSLRVRGWSRSLIRKGDKVQLYFNPLRDGRTGGSIKQLKLPSGQVLSGPSANLPGQGKACGFPP